MAKVSAGQHHRLATIQNRHRALEHTVKRELIRRYSPAILEAEMSNIVPYTDAELESPHTLSWWWRSKLVDYDLIEQGARTVIP